MIHKLENRFVCFGLHILAQLGFGFVFIVIIIMIHDVFFTDLQTYPGLQMAWPL